MMVDGNPLAVRGFNVEGLRAAASAPSASPRSSRCTGCCTATASRSTAAQAEIAALAAEDAGGRADVRRWRHFSPARRAASPAESGAGRAAVGTGAALRDGRRRSLGRPARRPAARRPARALAAPGGRRHRRPADGGARLRRLVAARQAGGARLCRGAAPLPRDLRHPRQLPTPARRPARRLHRRRCARLQPRLEERLARRREDDPLHQPVDLGLARQAHREDRPRRRPRALHVPVRAGDLREARHRGVYVGHPLADEIPLDVPRAASRAALGIERGRREDGGGAPAGQPPLRESYIAPRLLAAAAPMHRRRPALRFMFPASPGCAKRIEPLRHSTPPARRSSCSTAAPTRRSPPATSTLVASGTATLEAALFKRPMVIVYAMHRSLADEAHATTSRGSAAQHPAARIRGARAAAAAAPPESIAREALAWLDDPARCAGVAHRFEELIRTCGATPRGSPPMRSKRRWPACARGAAARQAAQAGGLMAGVDEAGRGPLAGPVVAAAVILDEGGRSAAWTTRRCSPPQSASGSTARSAPRALLLHRLGERRRDRLAQHPARHAARDATCRRGSAPRAARVLVDGNQLPHSRCRCSGDRRRCAGAGDLGGIDHRQGASRPAVPGAARRAPAIRLRQAQGLSTPGTWPRCASTAPAHHRRIRAGARGAR